MARRKAFVFAAPVMALAIVIFIGLITAILNVVMHTFGDDVAEWITEMPTLREYNYTKQDVFLCAESNAQTCKLMCDTASEADWGLGVGHAEWKFDDSNPSQITCTSPYTDSIASQMIKWRVDEEEKARQAKLRPDIAYEKTDTIKYLQALWQSTTEVVTFLPNVIHYVVTNPDTGEEEERQIKNVAAMASTYHTRVVPNPIEETFAKLDPKNETGKSRLPFYWMLAGIGFVILLINVMIGIIYWIFEDTPLKARENGMDMIKKSFYVGIYILLIPLIWDPVAVFMENSALFIMSIDGQHPGDITSKVILEAGAITFPNIDVWAFISEVETSGLETLGTALQNTFLVILLGVARAQATVLTMITMLITNIVRVEVTMLAVMIYPIAGALAITPIFKDNQLSSAVNKNILGGITAPIIGAVIFVIGYATLESMVVTDAWAIDKWITALTIMIMASTVPVATMTWVGSTVTQATSIIGGSFKTAMSVGAPVLGAVGGMMSGGGGAGKVAGGVVSVAGSVAGGAAGGAVGGAIGSSGGSGKGSIGNVISATAATQMGGGGVTPLGGAIPKKDGRLPDSAVSDRHKTGETDDTYKPHIEDADPRENILKMNTGSEGPTANTGPNQTAVDAFQDRPENVLKSIRDSLASGGAAAAGAAAGSAVGSGGGSSDSSGSGSGGSTTANNEAKTQPLSKKAKLGHFMKAGMVGGMPIMAAGGSLFSSGVLGSVPAGVTTAVKQGEETHGAVKEKHKQVEEQNKVVRNEEKVAHKKYMKELNEETAQYEAETAKLQETIVGYKTYDMRPRSDMNPSQGRGTGPAMPMGQANNVPTSNTKTSQTQPKMNSYTNTRDIG